LGLGGTRLSNALGYKLVWTCKLILRRERMVLQIPLGLSRLGFVKILAWGRAGLDLTLLWVKADLDLSDRYGFLNAVGVG